MTTHASPTRRFSIAAAALVLGVAGVATVAASTRDDAPVRRDFWSKLWIGGSEVFTPTTVDQMAAASGAIIVGRVTDVTADRQPARGHGISTVYLTVTVDSVVSGPASDNLPPTVPVRILKPPPVTIDELRAALPERASLFFIENLSTVAEREGRPLDAVSMKGKWRPVSTLGVLTDSDRGLVCALTATPDDFIATAGGADVAAVAERLGKA